MKPHIEPIIAPHMMDCITRVFLSTDIIFSLVVITGLTMNFIPSIIVINVEKPPIAFPETYLEMKLAINVNIKPEILIVDEALSVGDKAFRDKCLKKVRHIIEKDNVTLLFVTHAVGTAKQFCDRGIVMKKGKLIYDDDIDKAIEVFDNSMR